MHYEVKISIRSKAIGLWESTGLMTLFPEGQTAVCFEMSVRLISVLLHFEFVLSILFVLYLHILKKTCIVPTHSSAGNEIRQTEWMDTPSVL